MREVLVDAAPHGIVESHHSLAFLQATGRRTECLVYGSGKRRSRKKEEKKKKKKEEEKGGKEEEDKKEKEEEEEEEKEEEKEGQEDELSKQYNNSDKLILGVLLKIKKNG